MQPLPQLESCLRLAFDAGDPEHASGISLASYFVRAPTRGRRRTELDEELLFPEDLRARLGPEPIARAMAPSSFRTCPAPRPTVPTATGEWLAEAALALGRAEGFPQMWALLRAVSELEAAAQRLLGVQTPRSVVRRVLHGVGARTLHAAPFAALLVRVLKIAQTAYAAFRHADRPHGEAWAAVQDRLWAAHPTGRRAPSGADARGAYLPSLVQAASGNARRSVRRSAGAGRTQDHARALLARFAAGPGPALWPWTAATGEPLPEALTPEQAALCFFVVLTRAGSERRTRGGPSGGLSAALAEAGFASPEWLPDRTDDLAVRLLSAPQQTPRGESLEAFSVLLRASLSESGDAVAGVAPALQRLGVDLPGREARAMVGRARERLPAMLRWLEENGRDLLETS